MRTDGQDEGKGRLSMLCERAQKFYVLPTQCIYVFCVDLRTKSDYFPYTTLTDWFV